MPITAQAIKKLRHDRKRATVNEKSRRNLRKLINSIRKAPTVKTLTQGYQALDKAAKTKIIHANKASRIKSRLAKLLKK